MSERKVWEPEVEVELPNATAKVARVTRKGVVLDVEVDGAHRSTLMWPWEWVRREWDAKRLKVKRR
jgi:hypothetical protein